MIQEFADGDTESVFEGEYTKGLPEDIQGRAHQKLVMLNSAEDLRDLDHPGNRLEKLRGGRKGQRSIRINDQWRICFAWDDGDAYQVEIVDYH